MQPLDDYPIGQAGEDPPAPAGNDRNWRGWGVLAVALVVIAGLLAFLVTRPSTGPGAASTDPAVPGSASETPRRALGPEVEARDLPPLDLTDPLVRELVSALSSRPELAAWLATDGLIRNFVASVDAVANGVSPATHLRRLAPSRPFAAQPRGDHFVIDPQSYRRYDGIAETVASLDANGLARIYSTLRPRLQEAYVELGYPDAHFDSAVERAIGRLLDTPLVEGEVAVQRTPVLFQYVDPNLERLSAAQKHLVRMGPRNQRMIQDKLREVARALGAPAR